MAKKIRFADAEHRQLVSIAESLFRLANSVRSLESMARAEVERGEKRRREEEREEEGFRLQEERRERDLTLGQWIKFAPAMRAMVNDIVKAHPGWRLATVEETRLKMREDGGVNETYHAANGGAFSLIPPEEIITVTCVVEFTNWRRDFDEKAIAPFYAKREG